MDHVTHPYSFADISIFCQKSAILCYIKKYRHINSNSSNFSRVFKDCFNKRGENFDDVSKNGYLPTS